MKATDGEPPLTVKNILYIYKKFNYPSIYLYASNHTAYKERKDMTKEQNEFFQETGTVFADGLGALSGRDYGLVALA